MGVFKRVVCLKRSRRVKGSSEMQNDDHLTL
jgi:hypothetical protein